MSNDILKHPSARRFVCGGVNQLGPFKSCERIFLSLLLLEQVENIFLGKT